MKFSWEYILYWLIVRLFKLIKFDVKCYVWVKKNMMVDKFEINFLKSDFYLIISILIKVYILWL